MGEINGGFCRGETTSSGARKTRQQPASSLAYVASGTLVSVGDKASKDVAAVDSMAAETILLSCGYHHSCLTCTVSNNMPSTTSPVKAPTSPYY